MARLTLFKNNGTRTLDYKYTDKQISNFFFMSGTATYVHKYLGVYDQTANGIANASLMSGGIYAIEDALFIENRDRAYDPVVIELRGIYNVADVDFDLRQFGLFLQNDTIFLELHLNDMVAQVGRRIVAGDVIELPHQRDDTIPGTEDNVERPAINKFYVVEDASRASDGYSSTWYPHIWRIKCTPMTASQEFSDILGQQQTDPLGLSDTGTLGDLMSTIAINDDINNSVVEAALANFVNRNFETQQYWIMPGSETRGENPWVWAGDGIPPNGEGKPLQSGTSFPSPATLGEYYLRTDYSPATLFKRIDGGWQIQEIDYRQQEWTAAHRLLYDFINNQNTITLNDGTVENQRQALSQAIKARADF